MTPPIRCRRGAQLSRQGASSRDVLLRAIARESRVLRLAELDAK